MGVDRARLHVVAVVVAAAAAVVVVVVVVVVFVVRKLNSKGNKIFVSRILY